MLPISLLFGPLPVSTRDPATLHIYQVLTAFSNHDPVCVRSRFDIGLRH
jgi:hypothetical protein